MAANKIDALDEPERAGARCRPAPPRSACPAWPISAVTGTGVPALLEAAWPHMAAAREAALQLAADDDDVARSRDR